jgi:hypothetical protein
MVTGVADLDGMIERPGKMVKLLEHTDDRPPGVSRGFSIRRQSGHNSAAKGPVGPDCLLAPAAPMPLFVVTNRKCEAARNLHSAPLDFVSQSGLRRSSD